VKEPGTARKPYWPDSLAYTIMECGCRVEIIPIVLGLLDPKHVLCETHGWQPIERKKRDESRTRGNTGRGDSITGTLWDQEEEKEEDGSDGGRPPF